MPNEAEYQYVVDVLNLKKTLIPVPPDQLTRLSDPECLICRDEPEDPVNLPCPCRYVFCRNCITLALARNDACPTCQSAIFLPLSWIMAREQLLTHVSAGLRFFLRAPHLAFARLLVGDGSFSWAEVFIAVWAFRSLWVRDAYSLWIAFALSLLVFFVWLCECQIIETLMMQYDRVTPRRGLLQRASFRDLAQGADICLSVTTWTACCYCGFLLLFANVRTLIVAACQIFGGSWSVTSTALSIPKGHVLAILATAVMQTATRSLVEWLAK